MHTIYARIKASPQKVGGHEFNYQWLLKDFLYLTNVDEMKDLWCPSTV